MGARSSSWSRPKVIFGPRSLTWLQGATRLRFGGRARLASSRTFGRVPQMADCRRWHDHVYGLPPPDTDVALPELHSPLVGVVLSARCPGSLSGNPRVAACISLPSCRRWRHYRRRRYHRGKRCLACKRPRRCSNLIAIVSLADGDTAANFP